MYKYPPKQKTQVNLLYHKMREQLVRDCIRNKYFPDSEREFCEWSRQGLPPGVLKYLKRGKSGTEGRWAVLQASGWGEASSYLLIDLHGLFCVVEEELLPRRCQVHVYLQARVLRELPAVRPTAEGTVKRLRDWHIQQGTLGFFCPHTAEKGQE